jgi:hypothetical protein
VVRDALNRRDPLGGFVLGRLGGFALGRLGGFALGRCAVTRTQAVIVGIAIVTVVYGLVLLNLVCG